MVDLMLPLCCTWHSHVEKGDKIKRWGWMKKPKDGGDVKNGWKGI